MFTPGLVSFHPGINASGFCCPNNTTPRYRTLPFLLSPILRDCFCDCLCDCLYDCLYDCLCESHLPFTPRFARPRATMNSWEIGFIPQSGTLPISRVSVEPWPLAVSQHSAYEVISFNGSNSTMATTPNDSQVRAPSGYGMPIVNWYTDDMPWNPIVKVVTEPAYDRSLSKLTNYRNPISLYPDQSLPETGQFHPRAPQSDSDYGTYRNYESPSTFGANVRERDPHNHYMAGKASQHDSSIVDSRTPGSLPCQDPIEPNLELQYDSHI
jgi:hypothetical protein